MGPIVWLHATSEAHILPVVPGAWQMEQFTILMSLPVPVRERGLARFRDDQIVLSWICPALLP